MFDYRVHGIQIDRFQSKKLALKNMLQVLSFGGLVWKANFGHFFGNILGLGAYFSKPIFALKP